jgi:squalene-hopene/tetraprenyl-beta-curcumene cyclase
LQVKIEIHKIEGTGLIMNTRVAKSVVAWSLGALICAWAWLGAAGGRTVGAAGPSEKPSEKLYQQTIDKAIEYLGTKGQAADGSFSARVGPAVTAIVVTGLVRNDRSLDDPLVSKGLKYLAGFVRDDGGIYAEGSRIKNYETCVVLMAFVVANKDHRYDKIIKNADAYIRGLQAEGVKEGPADLSYGGVGYGNATRPDLSNTAFLIDALKAAGADSDDKALQEALTFVSRCQNFESEHNTTPYAAKNPDGGFYYTPLVGQGPDAEKTENGGLPSYGSMTYSGLKSMIFAGLGADDPRVKAAVGWVHGHYDLQHNPGQGTSGLFYYYITFAKALDALGENKIETADGKSHAWREDLLTELASRQEKDGSWVNANGKWLEGDANLATGFALLALSYCRPEKP